MSQPTTTSGPRIPTIPWVRMAYPHLWEPSKVTSKGVETGSPRYSCNLHLDNAPQNFIPLIQQAIYAAYVSKWPDERMRPPLRAQVGGDPNAWTNKVPGSIRVPLVWGPAEWPDDPNAKGWVLITTSPETSKPLLHQAIMASDGRTISGSVDLVDRATIYPGAECFANVSIYAYSKGGQQVGISAGLNGIAVTGRDLGRFDSRPSAGQMFGAGAVPDTLPPAAQGYLSAASGGGQAPALVYPQAIAPAPVYGQQAPAPVYGQQAPALVYPQAPAPAPALVYPQAPAPALQSLFD